MKNVNELRTAYLKGVDKDGLVAIVEELLDMLEEKVGPENMYELIETNIGKYTAIGLGY
jgi:hypothetical protein